MEVNGELSIQYGGDRRSLTLGVVNNAIPPPDVCIVTNFYVIIFRIHLYEQVLEITLEFEDGTKTSCL